MAKKTGRKARLKRSEEKRVRERPSTVFLPDFPEQVKAIAMQGLSDDEMAAVFGVSEDLMQDWKAFYPDFKKAIEAGRTQADARVVQALFHSAIGYSHPEEVVKITDDGDIHTYDRMKHYPPSHPSIKTWLTNRQKEHWKDRSEVESRHGLADDAVPGVRNETKDELISSILGLIKPKED